MRRFQLPCVWLLVLCGGCTLLNPSERFGAAPVSFAALSGWQDDDHVQALAAFQLSCTTIKPRPASSGSGLQLPENVQRSLCDEAMQIPPDNALAQQFFERRFAPYRVNNNGREEGLFTGYYEPVLYGSYHKGGDFLYPVYGPPPELPRQKPYLTHAEINGGALAHRRLELLWVDDPVMLFFLQVQGSGRIKLTNNKEIRINYADKNGQPYVSLGKIVGDEGLLPKDQINFFTLRQWLYQHHDQAIALLERNPSYVFFTLGQGPGPIGASGAVLTPLRSLAVDNRYIPYGLPIYLEATLPGPTIDAPPVAFRRLMMAQDTGGAIRGPVRGDVFFGPGDEAEYLAGYMKNRGSYTLLVPKEIESQLRP